MHVVVFMAINFKEMLKEMIIAARERLGSVTGNAIIPRRIKPSLRSSGEIIRDHKKIFDFLK